MSYHKILVAVDLTDESKEVTEKAIMLAVQNGATISLVHVIEPLSFAYGGDIPMDLSTLQDQLDHHAQKRLDSFAEQLEYPIQSTYIVTGHTESEIHRIAKDDHMDLVVVGSHGRHGLALLLGSTANGVLHGANCDVLAVRVDDD